jgi:signal transduction histidine kinase
MSKQTSTARWLTLCVAGILAAFVANTLYSRKVTEQVDGSVKAITENGSAGVIFLATLTEDIRLISARARQSTPENGVEDRATIDRWVADIDEVMRQYRSTEDYPGERELYLRAERQREPFLASLDGVLATVVAAKDEHSAALERFGATSSDLAATVRELTQLNAAAIAREGAAISQARRHASVIFMMLRIGMAILAIAGILLSWFAGRQQIALVESNEHLAKERAKELEMFAGRVAHDLRAPLTVIELKSEIADRADISDVAKNALYAIRRQGRRMGEIIDALLAFAQAGAAPEPERCDNIPEVVRDVLGDIQSVSSGSGIEFIVEPLRPVTAACSSRVLAIVLTNLVGNATKYIGAGQGGVRRIIVRMRENGERLQFEVEDNGPGLPSGKEEAVFEPFVRLSRSPSGGIGLGLATVKRLVEAHGGTVGVVSMPSSGCKFWFQLPLAPSLERSRRPRSDQSARAAS